jgi:acetoin utilization deacetylase AcuC-like enzyme
MANKLPVVFHELYSAPRLRPGHQFPMGVFQEIYDSLWRDEFESRAKHVCSPVDIVDRQLLQLSHDTEYVQRFLNGDLEAHKVRQIGFGDAVKTESLIQRTCAEVAGTLLTATLALQHGLALNCAGGTHHAFRDFGKGYCIMNDLALTSTYLIEAGLAKRVLILDLDVHQGDGTAALLQHRTDIFTCSFHSANNFPARKEKSDLDVALPDGCRDEEYMALLREILPKLLSSFKPDIVLFDAGVDVHREDTLGRLAITDDGLCRRENFVLDTVLAGFNIPIAGYVGGGYSDNLQVLAKRHMHLFGAAFDLWEDL